jgi:hypothetical protein
MCILNAFVYTILLFFLYWITFGTSDHNKYKLQGCREFQGGRHVATVLRHEALTLTYRQCFDVMSSVSGRVEMAVLTWWIKKNKCRTGVCYRQALFGK